MALELYDVLLVVVGITLLGIAVLPRVVARRPISMPLFFVAFGIAVFSLPWLPAPDPLEQSHLTERLAELGVIIALMALGLKIDRPPGVLTWSATWRLLLVAMPLSIAGAALLGWWFGGLVVPSAILLGAVIAPTDPVLAAEVQVQDPGEGLDGERAEAETIDEADVEHEVRFALSSEAGLNDGFAFPFTNLAIAVALVGVGPGSWLGEWLLIDVAYRIVVAALLGVVLGWIMAKIIFSTMPETRVGQSVKGTEAIAGTLIVYGITELLGAYGFISVFVAATAIREYERTHEYNRTLHEITELSEQVLLGVIMVFFGGAVANGLLEPLTLEAAVAAVAIVFLVRPAAGLVSLLGFDRPWIERGVIAFFGVRGIGSFYYLAYGLNEAAFAGAELVWAIVGAVVLVSILVHGVTATPAVSYVTPD
ncbi:cation:proton antiporter [Halopiger djelfimassiliensis]|uniref:cation:proton antiporter n=1 Tax=Halopiger djelfimassiliensis TaxID=1293047 RepID=UPI00067799C9|nr:cation:proton antiporter [Halopiger djelfimassiliensis]